ncbi:MAG: glutamate--cysteine ligase [Actinomycetaceae bacterium]|nr:glutamate--cysteine ligase [Actinomycetaceae bacterium]
MAIEFSTSERSTIGLEWELQLVDPVTRDLSQCAGEVFEQLRQRGSQTGLIHPELLQNMVELVSRKRTSVAECAADIVESMEILDPIVSDLGVELTSAGSHPFAQPSEQLVSETERYEELVERTQYWGRQMLIFGTHVHVGIDDRDKVIPIMNFLMAKFGHIQSFTAASPFWTGIDTGYADNRAMMFQQLPVAGMPYDISTWAELERITDELKTIGAIGNFDEVRWDIRPSPRFGTIELRACDASSNLTEVRAAAALVHCLIEAASRELDAGRELPTLPLAFREINKWRSSRYGMEATLVENTAGEQAPVAQSLPELVAWLEPVAADLRCLDDLAAVVDIARDGVGYVRQREVARRTGSLDAVVEHMLSETRAGRPIDPARASAFEVGLQGHPPVSGNEP